MDGQNEQCVVSREDQRTVLGGAVYGLYPRAWVDDGTRILFTRGYNGPTWVGIVDIDGSNLREVAVGAIARNCWPGPVSPDGTMVMLGYGSAMVQSLSVVDLSTGQTYPISSETYQGSWSPDGTRIAVTAVREVVGRSSLNIVSVDGAGRTDVASAVRDVTGTEFEPDGIVTWSADGTEIAVLNAADGQLYAVRLESMTARVVETHFDRYERTTAVEATTWGVAKNATGDMAQ